MKQYLICFILFLYFNSISNKGSSFVTKHTFSRFFKKIKEFLLNEIILLNSKFKLVNLIKSVKVSSSILVIQLLRNHKDFSELSPSNVDGSIVNS